MMLMLMLMLMLLFSPRIRGTNKAEIGANRAAEGKAVEREAVVTVVVHVDVAVVSTVINAADRLIGDC